MPLSKNNSSLPNAVSFKDADKHSNGQHKFLTCSRSSPLRGGPDDPLAINHIFKNRTTKEYKGIPIPPCGEAIGFKALMEENALKFYFQHKALHLFKYQLIKQSRSFRHSMLNLPPNIPTKRHLRFKYARYADYWILITNAPKLIVEKLKKDFTHFLEKELSATLSEEKTLVTDFRNTPAHFLGFEIRTYAHNRIQKVRLKNKE